MKVIVFGINHKIVELGQLERISMNADEVLKSLFILRQPPVIAELVILSTCNRIECYAVCDDLAAAQAALINHLRQIKGAAFDETLRQWYCKTQQAAKQHLFRVACGLDSLVVGENEIAGQIKNAYRAACQMETAGMILHKLFHAAFKTSKRVKNETEINNGCCSVGAAAVDVAEALRGGLQTATALIIGAGEIGQSTARILAKRRVGKILIANRTPEKAVALAKEVHGAAIPFYRIPEMVRQVDVIISSTSAPHAIMTRADVEKAYDPQRPAPLIIIDIALPRDFEPDIQTLPQIMLKNIYDLKALVDQNIKKREQEVVRVEGIIDEELQKFLEWQEGLKISTAIQAIKHHVEEMRREELKKYRYRFQDETFQEVEKLTRSLAHKYMHSIISQLKRLHEENRITSESLTLLEELFDPRRRMLTPEDKQE